MKRNLNKIISLIVIVLCLLFDVFYILYGSLWQKGLASSFFVILGIILFIPLCLTKKKLSFPILMLVGLTFSMIADILLDIHFITGAILFAVAHIWYIFSYSKVHKFHYIDLILGFCIMIPAILWLSLSTMFDYGDVLMKVVVIIYAIIISMMVGKAIGNFINSKKSKQKGYLECIIMIGSFLFFFSDTMLLLNVFADFPKVVDVLCLVSYYPAQILLASSIGVYKLIN